MNMKIMIGGDDFPLPYPVLLSSGFAYGGTLPYQYQVQAWEAYLFPE